MPNTRSIDWEQDNNEEARITDAAQTGLDLAGDLTFELWAKLENDTDGLIHAKWADGATGGPWFFWIQGGKPTLDLSDDGTQTDGHWQRWQTSSATVSTGSWTHIAVTFDIDSETAVFYINGSSVATTQTFGTTIGATLVNNGSAFRINDAGGATVGTGEFDGLMDEVRIWNVTRTGTEISNNYQKELVGNESGLVAYWKMNNSLLDETSNNNDLTHNGTQTYSTDVPFIGTAAASPSHNLLLIGVG